MSNLNANLIIEHDRKKMTAALEAARDFIDRNYLGRLSTNAFSVCQPIGVSASSVRLLKLRKLVYGDGDIHSHLLSTFNALHDITDTCFMLLSGHKDCTDIYLGIHAQKTASLAVSALKNAIDGSFPGTEFYELTAKECVAVMNTVAGNDCVQNTAVSAVTQVPSLREKDGGVQEDAQNIEHFIEGMEGREYTAVIIAEPMSTEAILSQRKNLENIYSSLSALSQLTYQYSENSSSSVQQSFTETISNSITHSVNEGYSYGTVTTSGSGNGGNISTYFDALRLGYGFQSNSFSSVGTQQSNTTQYGTANQCTAQAGKTSGTGASSGVSEAITIKQSNKAVEEMLYRLDEQIKRLRECETYSSWNCCAFFCSPAPDIAIVAANLYRAITCGARSGNGKTYLNCWNKNANPEKDINNIFSSLQNAGMPVFKSNSGVNYSCGAIISGSELPLLINLPLHSIRGVPVVKMAAFGRSVYDLDNRAGKPQVLLKIGMVRHLGRTEESPVTLDINSFSAHTLVCGTTGVGKSTLMSMILTSLSKAGIGMLIVEPVKGEYRNLLHDVPNMNIYTVNPLKNKMLHLNPFEFDTRVHVLSHIDRLIEVFSVCWPLYAAQPAMLRECVEEAYIRTGWDISNSIFTRPDPIKFPNFTVLLKVVPDIIKKSKFVGETKGTYEGALLTRIAMLADGIYGQVFNSGACLNDRQLFDSNTIIDLSEAGSGETISLIMGVLIVRLKEYRAVSCIHMNSSLRHVMVIEEAHNIFKSSRTTNSDGGENISGKSVEMLSQCIAEMRGYGQGIFIVDQSPNAIDISGIRNTATKIFLRLPETEDQRVAANSLSLSENQVDELARLPVRTAVVYQTGWLEPVQVLINEAKTSAVSPSETFDYNDMKELRGFITKMALADADRSIFDGEHICSAMRKCITGLNHDKLEEFVNFIQSYNSSYKCLRGSFSNPKTAYLFFAEFFNDLLSASGFCRLCALPLPHKKATKPYANDESYRKSCAAWKADALHMLDSYVSGLDEREKERLLEYILLSDLSSPQRNTVHNVLYGVIPKK